MPWYHKAQRRPIDRYQKGGTSGGEMPAPKRLVLHTAVSNGSSLYALFAIPGNPVAHFYVAENGTVEQYVDTDRMASAVLEGNHDCITVESWDGYGDTWKGGSPGPKWTPEQVETLAQLAAWCHKQHGIPLERLTSSKPGTSGVGWHRLGIDGNFPQDPGHLLGGRVKGGELWTNSPGKECPTDTRIKQTVDEVIPRAVEIASGKPDPKPPVPEHPHQDEVLKAINQGAQAAKDAGNEPTRWRKLRQAFNDLFGKKEK